MHQTMTITAMADQLQVSREAVRQWLQDDGIPAAPPEENEARILVRDLAPLSGRRGLCDQDCPGWHFCRLLQRAGLWTLCAPPDHKYLSRVAARFLPDLAENYKLAGLVLLIKVVMDIDAPVTHQRFFLN